MDAWDVTEAMIVYGGNFVRQLGMLIRAADTDNKRRLVEAFPEYLDRYREMARMRDMKNPLRAGTVHELSTDAASPSVAHSAPKESD